MNVDGPITFIVRVSKDDTGRLTGIVERVKTGKKEQFHTVEAISQVIARMVLGKEDTMSQPDHG